MKITAQQRKALEAAGYTVGKSGNTVQKDGKTVGGYNANGQMFSGSSKIKDILKAKPEAAAKPAARATSAPASRAAQPTRPRARPSSKGQPSVMSDAPKMGNSDLSTRPLKVTTTPISNTRGGRGDGAKERVVRAADAALARNAKINKNPPTPPRSKTPTKTPTKPQKTRSVVGDRPNWSLGGILGWGDKKKKE